MLKKITQKLLNKHSRSYKKEETRKYLMQKRRNYRHQSGMAFQPRTSGSYYSNISKL